MSSLPPGSSPRRRRVGTLALAAAIGVALGSCTAGDRAEPPSPSVATGLATTAAPVPAPSTTLRLPPPPAGGFDPPVEVRFDGAPALTAEVARRPDQRARGLMQRTELRDQAGMIFVFPDRASGGFYMLGTLIPLSIAYVDVDRVVSTAEMTPCPGQDCPTYPPAAPYTLAVEAPAGFFPRWGVGPGTRVQVIGRIAAPQ